MLQLDKPTVLSLESNFEVPGLRVVHKRLLNVVGLNLRNRDGTLVIPYLLLTSYHYFYYTLLALLLLYPYTPTLPHCYYYYYYYHHQQY